LGDEQVAHVRCGDYPPRAVGDRHLRELDGFGDVAGAVVDAG